MLVQRKFWIGSPSLSILQQDLMLELGLNFSGFFCLGQKIAPTYPFQLKVYEGSLTIDRVKLIY
jgi:hypothetical protein